MALTHTDSFDERSAILQSLDARNRVVALLRIVVPAAGLAALGLLIVQIYVANTLHQYGVSGIRIDRGALVVDAPHYAGTSSDGSRYSATAREAHAAINDPSVVTMQNATLTLTRPGMATLTVRAREATADTNANVVTVPGVATFSDKTGLHGSLSKLTANLDTGISIADGPVDITYPDGTRLNAAGMRYDSTARRWTFSDASLLVPTLPEATP